MCADDFYTAHGVRRIRRHDHRDPVLRAAPRRRASPTCSPTTTRARAEKAVIDYGFHLIVANPDEADARHATCRRRSAQGIRSFKIFMTYDRMRLHRRADPRRDGRRAQARRAASWCMPRTTASSRWLAGAHGGARATSRRATTRSATRAASESRGDQPRHRAGRGGRRADPHRARLARIEGIEAIRAGARARRQDLRRDLPAVPVPHRRRTSTARPGRRDVLLQRRRRATKRRRRRAGRAEGRHARRCIRPTTRRTASTPPASCPRARRPRSRKWPTACRGSSCGCRCCSPTAYGAGRITLNEFVALTATATRRSTACYPHKGTIAVGRRCRHRDLGPGAAGHDRRRDSCTTTSATRPTRAASSRAGR